MRTVSLISLLLIAGAMNGAPAFAAERWVAVDPNLELSAPAVWGNTEDEAKQRAIEACERVSETCAGSPATTDDMSDILAAMCCQQPQPGCAVGVGKTRDAAAQAVRKTFSDAGYSDCTLRHYLSARNGRKLR